MRTEVHPHRVAAAVVLAAAESVADLQSKLVRLNDEAQAIQARADGEGRDLTDREQREITAIFTSFEQTEGLIKRRETLDAQADRLNAPGQRRSVPPDPADTSPVARAHGHGVSRPGHVESRMTGASAPAMSAALEALRGDDHGFHSLGAFLRSVSGASRGHSDNRLQRQVWNASEGTGEDGGFTVPPAYIAEILEPSLIYAGVVDRVRQIPLRGTNALQIAGFGTSTHADGAIGNLKMAWVGEGGQLSAQKAKARAVTLKAQKGTIYVEASNELLNDSPAASMELGRLMSEAIASGLEDAILNGNGAGQPLGVLNSPALITIAKESGQTADTILWENLVKAVSRMHPAHLANAVWTINQSVLEQLLTTYFPIDSGRYGGSSGIVSGEKVFAIDAAGSYSILGRPVLVSEHSPILGDAGDILLADFSQYFLAMIPMLGVEVSQHVRFDYDVTALRLVLRVDGQSRWSAPLTPATGATTVSPFVTLAERA